MWRIGKFLWFPIPFSFGRPCFFVFLCANEHDLEESAPFCVEHIEQEDGTGDFFTFSSIGGLIKQKNSGEKK